MREAGILQVSDMDEWFARNVLPHEPDLRRWLARVAADPALAADAAQPGGSAKQWRYWRLHGSPRMYYSEYGDAVLRELAPGLRNGDWVIFDNTAHGHALGDAARLQDCLRS